MTPEEKEEIRNIIREEFQKNYLSGSPQLAPHTHNGVDNLPVDAVLSLTPGTGITITPSGSTSGNLTINSSGSLEVTDGITTVIPTTIIEFPSGSVTDNGGGDVSIAVSATPAGSDFNVQYNVSSAFAADPQFQANPTLYFIIVGFTAYFIAIFQYYGFNIWNFALDDSTIIAGRKSLTVSSGTDNSVNPQVTVSAELYLTSTDNIYIEPTNNLSLFFTNDFGSGVGVVGVGDATTPPTVTPTGGGILYSQGGALHWLGSSGTDTIIAPA